MGTMKFGVGISVSAIFVACVAMAAEGVSKSGWETAYSRRDLKLGMSLSQVKAMPHPDQKEWPGAFLACSNEERVTKEFAFSAARLHSTELHKTGVVKCRFFYAYSSERTMSAGLMMGDIASSTELFFIKPEPEPDYILFWIVSGGPAGKFASLIQSFSAAYGKPKETRVDKWQNRAGGVFDNSVMIWRNSVSEIELQNFGETTQALKVTHRLIPLFKILNSRLQSVRAENAKKL